MFVARHSAKSLRGDADFCAARVRGARMPRQADDCRAHPLRHMVVRAFILIGVGFAWLMYPFSR